MFLVVPSRQMYENPRSKFRSGAQKETCNEQDVISTDAVTKRRMYEGRKFVPTLKYTFVMEIRHTV
jgi:hypothetical protein